MWHLNYQDVIAIGHLMTSGQLDVTRVVSVAGPTIQNPAIVRTQIGVSLETLLREQLPEGEHRTISGNVLSGRAATGVLGYLGRYHLQVTSIAEGNQPGMQR